VAAEQRHSEANEHSRPFKQTRLVSESDNPCVANIPEAITAYNEGPPEDICARLLSALRRLTLVEVSRLACLSFRLTDSWQDTPKVSIEFMSHR
jgi:hypothetical protein